MQTEGASGAGRLRSTAPGAAFAIALAAAAKLGASGLEQLSIYGTNFPISSVLCAVLLGIVWRNAIGVPARYEAGLHWVMHNLLRAGIVLVGSRLTLIGIAGTVATATPVVIGCISTALLVGLGLARALGISRRLGQLLAVGAAVCGCTAVVALAPVIRARNHETGFAVACVVLFGCIGMLLHPVIAHLLFEHSPLHAGIFLSTAIHDTSQVIGAGLIYSQQYSAPEALAAASVTKLLRNLSIAVLIPAAAWLRSGAAPRSQTASAAQALPMFVIVFLVLIVVRTAGDGCFLAGSSGHEAWQVFIKSSERVCELLLICGMTAVGLGVSLVQLRQVGLRPLLAGAGVAMAVSLCSAMLTTLMQLFFS